MIDTNGPNGCHLWMGFVNPKGYGEITLDPEPGKRRGKSKRVHVFAWERVNGPLPEGLQVNHNCHVEPCCNPEHLYAGTQQQNIQDQKDRGTFYTGPRGVKKTSLSPEFIEAVKASPLKQVEASRHFGISQSHVSRIRRGKFAR